MANRFLLESLHINELKEAQAENLLSDRALKLYGNLDLELIQEALAIAAQSARSGILAAVCEKGGRDE